MSNEHIDPEAFGDLLSQCQDRLYAYVLSLIGSRSDVEDILQNANVVLLRRAADFEMGTNFGAWACRVVFYEVLAWRKTQSRDRLIFDDEMLSLVAQQAEIVSEQADAHRQALRHCMKMLTPAQRALLQARYEADQPLHAFAEQVGRPVRSVYQSLHRVRTRLSACVREYCDAEASA